MPRPSGGRSSGEPCTKCGLPVFIAERLSVKKQLYHRTCFRCARCNSQLSLANYYETETEKQFCCETCPDEEQLEQNEKDLIEKSVLTRSLSDEEKSAGIQKFDEQDDYSCLFETALEDPNDTKLTKNYTLSSEQSAEFIKARSRFMTSQLVSDYDDDSSENEVPDLPNSEPPSLPQSEPPDLPKTQPPDFDEFVAKSELIIVDDQVEKTIENSENTEVENFKDLSENISSIVSSDSGFPSHTQSLDSLVHSSVKVSEISDRSQPETANKQLDINKFVTKENKFPRSDGKAPTSLVKSRMRLFENKFAGDQSTEIDNSSVKDVNKSVVEKFIQKVPSEEEEEKQSSTGLENKKHDVEEIETDNTINSVDIEDNKSHTEQKSEEQTSVEDNEKNILITNDLPELQIENTSDINEIILISDDEEKSSEISSNNLKELKINNVDTSSSIIIIDDSKEETNEKYPEDLNPFGDEEEEPTTKPNTSLNPFGDDEDEIEEKKPSPKPAVRRKIKPSNRELLVSGQSDGTPEYISELRMQRISMNRFEVDEHSKIGDKLRAHTMKLISPTPRINLNPFWSDGEEPDDDEEEEKQRPIPLPRNSRGSIGTPEPKPRKSGLSITSGLTRFGSNTSLSSAHSSIGPVGRKKKQAPKPPSIAVDSAHSSVTSSPSVSAQHSPKLTPRIRKTKKAPLPPSVTSTPFLDAKIQQKLFSMDVSPIGNEESKEPTESTVATETGEWEKEKNLKDEVNRNRQSQAVISPVSSSENSANLSVPNKSTYGKWKRRKGPAPSRPIPQRRNIKPLPMTEIKRELDLIEIQQQGLEKQGVRLEQIIREKCEGPNVDLESSLAPETEDLILQLFELVNEKNELFRKQAELMYLRRQQRLEEEYADLEYQIRCLMMQPEANKTDTDKTREEELISRLVEVVERRNEIVECLEMDRVRESEEDDSINVQLNLYASKREEDTSGKVHLDANKQKKKGKKEKKFKFKSNKKVDVDKDIDECESSSTTSAPKDKKKKKFNIF